MSVLALDTSSAIAVAVTSENGHILAQRALDQERCHVEGLAPMRSVARSTGPDTKCS